MQYSTLIRKKDKGYQYIITYKHNNKWKTKSKQGFKHRQEAQEVMDKTLKELKKTLKNSVDPKSEGITFKEFSQAYIEHISLYRETNTIKTFETAVSNFSDLNEYKMPKITNIEIQKCVDNLVRNGLKTTSIKLYLSKLALIFNEAIKKYKLMTDLPTIGIEIHKNKEGTNKKALNKNEIEEILTDLNGTRYYLVILIALKCGLRLGEILGLTWDDVDEKNNVLIVNKQWKFIKKKEYGFGELKSKNSNREVPIPSSLMKELIKYSKVKNINNKVFNFKSTNSVCNRTNIILRKYGVTFHELRHTYATTLISNGMDFKTAAKLLGHNVEQTMKTYSHVNDDMMTRAKSMIENIF